MSDELNQQPKRDQNNQKPVGELDGLKTVVMVQGNDVKIKLSYEGKFGLGYDGCGTHTHK